MTKPLSVLFAAACCALCLGAHAASPVHVALKPSAAVEADADGFFTLASIADLTGGDAGERAHLGAVRVGRAPLPEEVRHLAPGDVILKLRQAGFHPRTDTVLGGASQVSITLASDSSPDAAPAAGGPATRLSPTASPAEAPIVIHRGDPVSILVQDNGLTVTAHGAARDAGRVGEMIHVHRDGVMTDLSVTVLDSQTVRLEP